MKKLRNVLLSLLLVVASVTLVACGAKQVAATEQFDSKATVNTAGAYTTYQKTEFDELASQEDFDSLMKTGYKITCSINMGGMPVKMTMIAKLEEDEVVEFACKIAMTIPNAETGATSTETMKVYLKDNKIYLNGTIEGQTIKTYFDLADLEEQGAETDPEDEEASEGFNIQEMVASMKQLTTMAQAYDVEWLKNGINALYTAGEQISVDDITIEAVKEEDEISKIHVKYQESYEAYLLLEDGKVTGYSASMSANLFDDFSFGVSTTVVVFDEEIEYPDFSGYQNGKTLNSAE
ncbi:MAG: hypothetical protein IJ542_01220 [Clostridia bacterium]|nr:hypothetical protein [Clostridia bacterium]